MLVTLLRRGMILAGVVLVSVLGGFCLCLWLHRMPQDGRSPVPPAHEPPAPDFVPPTGNSPQPSADVPHETPVIATGHGTVEFGPKEVRTVVLEANPGPAPPCFLRPEDIAGDCDFEIVGTPDAPMLRMKWTGRVRVRDGQQVRGPITLPDVAFDWRPPAAPVPRPRTLLGLHGGVSSSPGYEVGADVFPASWAFQTRVAEGRIGVYGEFQRDISEDRVAVGATILFGVGRR